MKTKIYLCLFSFLFALTGLNAQTLTVDNNGDASDASAGDGLCDDGSGNCTLRAAIEEANANASITTIEFSAGMTITPATKLPNVTRAGLTIDGASAPGASCGTLVTGAAHSLAVIIDGSSLPLGGDGLEVSGSGATVQGLVIQNCPDDGIVLSTSNVTVQCCFIGTNQAGTGASPNGDDGISFSGITNVGHSILNNLLSGNGGAGIYIGVLSEATIKGNLIGTNVSGTSALPNTEGIQAFGGRNCIIGGSAVTDRNVISGNSNNGYAGGGTGSPNQQFFGNYIGVDIGGATALGNGDNGIRMGNGNNSFTIGGTGAGQGNVISGNGNHGIWLRGDCVVLGNYIGTGAGGSGSIGNNGAGIHFNVSSNNTTVGNVSGGGNVIANNVEAGIEYTFGATNGSGNSLRGNSIFDNGGLGIDLNEDGADANDPGDSDTGANNLQNSPDISHAYVDGSGTVHATFSVNSSTTNSTYPLTIDFYKADTDGEEGQEWLGALTYTSAEAMSDKSGSFFPAAAMNIGEEIVATATDNDGNTSEFSTAFVLPVELVSFSAKPADRGAILEWRTASETDNAGFKIEKMTNGEWEKIGFVAGAGTVFSETKYDFKTAELTTGTHYFRLRQMDFDGQSTLSNTVSIRMEKGQAELNFFPNPVQSSAQLALQSEWEGEATVTIFDGNGRMVRQHFFQKENGPATLEMDWHDLPAGPYFLTIEMGSQVEQMRVVKK